MAIQHVLVLKSGAGLSVPILSQLPGACAEMQPGVGHSFTVLA